MGLSKGIAFGTTFMAGALGAFFFLFAWRYHPPAPPPAKAPLDGYLDFDLDHLQSHGIDRMHCVVHRNPRTGATEYVCLDTTERTAKRD